MVPTAARSLSIDAVHPHYLPIWARLVRDLGFPIVVSAVLLYGLVWRQPAEIQQLTGILRDLVTLEQQQLQLLVAIQARQPK